MAHEVADGKIQADHLELNIVHHCNLSCRACNHAAPRMPKHFAAPEALYRDLSLLGRYYRPASVHLLGGEPLLHPRLGDVVEAVRASGICPCIRIVTNGLLLLRGLHPGFYP